MSKKAQTQQMADKILDVATRAIHALSNVSAKEEQVEKPNKPAVTNVHVHVNVGAAKTKSDVAPIRKGDVKSAGDEYLATASEFDAMLRSREGVLPRRATYLAGASKERYQKGTPVHDASGKFRRSDAKG
jgi:hypothetical protein